MMPTARRATASAIAPIDWAAACERAGLPYPPVAYYPLGGGWGTSDASPNANHGTPQNGASPTGSPWGGAYDFGADASGMYLRAPSSSSYNALPYSASFWFAFNVAPNNFAASELPVCGREDSSTSSGWWFARNEGDQDDHVRFGTHTGNIKAVADWGIGQWHHVVLIQWSNTDAEVWVDGTLNVQGDNGFDGHATGTPLRVAYKAYKDGANAGGVDVSDVAVWDYPLLEAQIRWLYNHPRGFLQPTSRIEQWAAAIGGADATSVSFSMGASFGVSAQAQASAQASSALAQSVGAGMDAAAASGAEVPVSHVESVSVNAQASAPTDVALTATMGLSTQSDVAGVVEVEFTMDMLAGLSFEADAGAAVSTALGMASGLSMAGSAQVDENISADIASQIQVSETAHANTQVPLGVQATLATIADAVATAGYTMDVVQTITITGTTVKATLELPDGRTFLVEAKTRTFEVEDEQRIFEVE